MSQVLALKYRPHSFDKLIGQESVRITLSKALDTNRLSYAYLFSGLRGSGKTSTARIFAKALLCDNGPTSKPCEKCSNCIQANEGRHIDIIEMDGASSRKIDDIRELIEQTKYKPNSGRFKIFIIDEVHMLTKEAFNALLKTLEEPPEYVKFILATTDPLKLPSTILSRTQHFRFKKISQSDIINHISHILNLENIPYEEDALKIIARAGNGSLRDTLTILDQAIIYTNRFLDTKSIANMIGVLDPEFFEKVINIILKSDKKAILEILKELEEYEAEIIIDEFILYLNEKFLEQDKRFNLMLFERYFRILSSSKNLLSINNNGNFILALTFFKMIEANKLKDINELIEDIEQDLIQKPIQNIPPKESLTTTKQIEKNYIHNNTTTYNNSQKQPFEKLLKLLYEKDKRLGECFSKNISFISFLNDTLTLSSTAQDECRKMLRDGYSFIKYAVKEVFTPTTIIKVEQKQPYTLSTKPQNKPKQSTHNEPNCGSSCVANSVIGETKEIDPSTILENPFVKKATQLFQPTKIYIKSKV